MAVRPFLSNQKWISLNLYKSDGGSPSLDVIKKPFLRLILALVISAGALVLRLYAASSLITDYDESVYVPIALDYANFIREGDLKGLVWYRENLEHPVFQKILYGLVLLTQDPLKEIFPHDLPELTPLNQVDAKPWLLALRQFSALLSAVGIFFLGLLHPAAAVFLGIQTVAIRYTSQAYLESLPTMCILISYYCFVKMIRLADLDLKKWLWLSGSAIFLAGAVASKYPYGLPGLAIGMGWIFHFGSRYKQCAKRVFPPVIAGVISLIFFFMLDPIVWVRSWDRFWESLAFHFNYTGRHYVISAALPYYHALSVLITPVPQKYPEISSAFFIQLDFLIAVLALVGLVRTARREPVVMLWTVLCLVFLIGWQTRWDQHVLIILPALSICAANGLVWLYDYLRSRLHRKQKLQQP